MPTFWFMKGKEGSPINMREDDITQSCMMHTILAIVMNGDLRQKPPTKSAGSRLDAFSKRRWSFNYFSNMEHRTVDLRILSFRVKMRGHCLAQLHTLSIVKSANPLLTLKVENNSLSSQFPPLLFVLTTFFSIRMDNESQ